MMMVVSSGELDEEKMIPEAGRKEEEKKFPEAAPSGTWQQDPGNINESQQEHHPQQQPWDYLLQRSQGVEEDVEKHEKRASDFLNGIPDVSEAEEGVEQADENEAQTLPPAFWSDMQQVVVAEAAFPELGEEDEDNAVMPRAMPAGQASCDDANEEYGTMR